MNSSKFIKIYFDRKKKNNPAYSVRALARDLQMSPSFTSEILTGHKRIPQKRLKRLCEVLEIDSFGERKLLFHLMQEVLSENGFSKKVTDLISEEDYAPASKGALNALSPWYLPAILDLSTCDDFQPKPQFIANKLGISVKKTEEALKHLLSIGLLEFDDLRLKKSQNKLRITANQSKPQIRAYHTEMMKLAIDKLNSQTDQQSYDLRLITGITTAASPEKLKQIKNILESALYKAVELFSAQDCTEVYQINLQLFPLTKVTK